MKRMVNRRVVRKSGRRGIALLLVMIGLVVCTILTAGFLSSQGTSIGIVRNERDSEKCRAIAQSGVEMSYWLVKNNAAWRENMAPGKWLNNVTVGDGTVTVTAYDGDSTGSFSDDPTQTVILQSVGSYDGRTFTLTATIGPTGGGTVFRGGNFFAGSILLRDTGVADSYNSSVANYNALFPGANNIFWSNSTANGAITINFPATFRGSITLAPTSIIANVLNLLGALLFGPTSTIINTETRVAGTVVPPNMTGLAAEGPYTKTSSSWTMPGPGQYDSFTLQNSLPATIITVPTSGIYQVSGAFTMNAGTKLVINPGVNAVFYINGVASISGTIQLGTGSSLIMYTNGLATVSSAIINSGGDTSKALIMGTSNSSQIELKGTTTMYGAIFAPQSDVLLDTGSPKLFGAVVGKTLTIKNSAQFHYDQNLQTMAIDNVTGGSAPQGTADYLVNVVSSH